jgi:hypothetical protein
MRHAHVLDTTRFSLALEPRHVLAPRDEIVDLLDVDPTEPLELTPILFAPFVA